MTKAAAKTTSDFLFELGTEELPATNLADFYDGSAEAGLENPLVTKFKKALEDHRLSAAETAVWATPRRLVFWAKDVPAAQKELITRTRLLAKEESYGPDGKPTEKLLTILKHRNARIEDVVMGEANGKPNTFLEKKEPSRKTPVVLQELCTTLTKAVGFPKNMKWDDSGLFFARPIRSLACYYGTKPVAIRIGNLKSKSETSSFSKGTRTRLAAKDIPSYFKALDKAGVMLDPAPRKAAIKEILEKLAKMLDGKLYDDPFLLNEVNFLVEQPQGLAAPFGEEYLTLPLEVLAVSMARKQRIFGLVDAKGKVLPRFLAILDGAAKDKEKKIISTNMEHILHAKLKDSLFFWNEDSKTPLGKKRDESKNLVFLKGAGSMLEKSERLEKLAGELGPAMGLSGDEISTLKRAAHLSKADLLTHMVGEFPELQGVMGKYYAKLQGENDAVSEAIGEQYLPRTVSDKLPATRAGAALSALDKTDLVAACFALGMEPSSSADPYALRRSATAAVKIILDRKFPLTLEQLCDKTSERFQSANLDQARAKTLAFFKDRLRAALAEKGYRADWVDAVLASGVSEPARVLERLEKLAKLSSQHGFAETQKSVERTSNILKGAKDAQTGAVDAKLLSEPLEQQLWKRFEEAEPAFKTAVERGDFALATRLYADAFFAILGEFFEKVFINAEDPAVRKNRLALVRSVKELYTKNIADLSKIQAN